MTLLAFLIALGLLVTIHEWGHYRMALWCGVRVLRFSIGFGRPLWRWTRRDARSGHDIEFVVGWLPLGGYVKLLDEEEGEVPEAERHLAFSAQSLGRRAAIVFAGPLANLVLAVLLYSLQFAWGQWQTQAVLAAPLPGSVAEVAGVRSGDTLVRAARVGDARWTDLPSWEAFRWWLLSLDEDTPIRLALASGREVELVPPTDPSPDEARYGLVMPERYGLVAPRSTAQLREVLPDSAAQRAGLRAGDVVLRIDDEPIEDAGVLRRRIRAAGTDVATPREAVWHITRHGEPLTVMVQVDVLSEGEQRVGRLGALIGAPPERVWVQSHGWAVWGDALQRTWDVAWMNLESLWRMLSAQTSWQQLGGPLAIAEGAGRSLEVGIVAYVGFLALLSTSLGVFNLLPIPALDGGRLMYYLWELFMGHPPAGRWLHLYQQAGLMALFFLMAVAVFNDLNRWVG